MHLSVECIAIDEVQLASDYERGHIFTERLINYRGSMETIFLGSLTIEAVLKKIFPKIKIEKRDRFSKLSFVQKQNISKLKPRTAIIAFNINKVYEIAEKIRTYKGGTAVVLGSLSPRTRNAQVSLYENKDVDYLVATDAIGMGLNLNIDHVSFSSFRKFDGRYNRNLLPAEIGQIAGRAGRYRKDGTFGYTKEAEDLDPMTIQSIEDHNFHKIERIYWRNSNLDFSSVNALLNSLKQFPVKNFYIHKKNAQDEISFRILSEDAEIKKYLSNRSNINLLWDICRVPDFQKIMNDTYVELLKNIFLNLMKNNLTIPEDWINKRVSRLEDYSGGIDELSIKISNIRTWTYISNQSNWLEKKEYWQDKTRKIEDNLSDHLHESLTNRFIDISASYFINHNKKGIEPKIEINSDKSISLNGKIYGYINGFNLKLIDNSKSISLYSHKHVKKTIILMIEDRINNFLNAPFDSINLSQINRINLNKRIELFWGDEAVGYLKKGDNIFSPMAQLLDSEFLETDKRDLIRIKLQQWIDERISTILKPIKADLEKTISSSYVRSIIYNLFNFLGSMNIENYKSVLKNITTKDKLEISKFGIRLGAKYFFIPNFLKKNSMELNAMLWNIYNQHNFDSPFPLPVNGRVSFVSEIEMPDTYWSAIGYICINSFAVRIDVFERIFFIARKKIKKGPFLESAELMNPIGCNSKQLANILFSCGFDNILLENEKILFFNLEKKPILKKNIIKKKKKVIKIEKNIKVKNINNTKKIEKKQKDPNSPFAVLEKLL